MSKSVRKNTKGQKKGKAKAGIEPILAPEVEVLPAEDTEITVSARDILPATSTPPSKSKAIVSYDPLAVYLRDMARYPMLSKDEEKALAIKVFEHKDREAAYKLITSHLWLAVKIARDYERAAKNLLDLIQEGNIGLMEAVKNFDPYKEVRFPSYAVWWIKAYIIRYIMANLRLVKIGTTQAQRKLFFNLKKEKDKLEREGFFPSPKLLAEKLSVRESEVVEMEQRLGSSDLSVDAPLSDDSEAGSTLLSVLSNNDESAEDLLSRKQSQKLLKESIDEFTKTLNPKEQAIFHERLLNEDKATLNDLADRFDLSRERIRQLEGKIKDKFRLFLQERLGEALDSVVE